MRHNKLGGLPPVDKLRTIVVVCRLKAVDVTTAGAPDGPKRS